MNDFMGITSKIKSCVLQSEKDGKNVERTKQREALPTPSRQSSKVFGCSTD
jgi:hypothetical protein